MSTDQYPEVSSDDSGLVPQNAPRQEWPKKIRTLTAAELDRLTIDGDGRFYWDGHLVNYQPPQAVGMAAPSGASQPTAPVDLDALALLDRAARELSGQPAETTPAAAQPHHIHQDSTHESVAHDAPVHDAPTDAPASSDVPVVAVAPVAPIVDAPQLAPGPAFDMTYRMPTEKVRVRMSIWQSLALVLVILGLLVAATGLAVSGLVAAHEWGCRTNLVKQYCPPPPPAPKPPARFDIPA